jgi:nucleoside 2-deoxyribosyltransferase
MFGSMTTYANDSLLDRNWHFFGLGSSENEQDNVKKVYLAGWDVFRPDAVEEGKYLKNLCKEYGFEGLYPLDNESDNPEDIYKGNIELLEQADYVIANVNAFRGSEPDSGTSFEIGYAIAMGKPVVTYLEETRPMIEWVKDENGYSIENFGFPVNLMIAESTVVVNGDAEDALKKLCEIATQ